MIFRRRTSATQESEIQGQLETSQIAILINKSEVKVKYDDCLKQIYSSHNKSKEKKAEGTLLGLSDCLPNLC